MSSHALLAIHYQNENCHPDGKIKVGIAADAPWREERLGNAKRLLGAMRAAHIPVIHVRLAVDPQYRDVKVNTPLIREWVEMQAWQEGTWGTRFIDGLGPVDDELVITHTRNSVFHGCAVHDALTGLGVEHVYFAGVSTAYAVEGSVRHATDLGYTCTVVADACATATQVQHANALSAMTPLAGIISVDELARQLDSRPG